MSKSLKKLIDINRLREFKNKLVGAGSAYVQTSAVDQTIAGTKTFSKPIVGSVTGSSGSCTGNAASASSVPWSGVTGKPSSYIPAAHTQAASTITGLAKVATSGSYNDLTNKPAIPTVNNATLTIQKNGTTVKTFTANASANVTANITVPTKVSELTNDSGFLTSHQSLSNYVTLNGAQTISGAKTFTGNIIGINKDNSTEDANSLYSTTAGSKLTYYTTSNGSTKLTNVPATVNTTLESRTIRRLSNSDWVVEQICHNNNGLYYRKGINGTWGAWKTFAFTDSNISGNAATATKATKDSAGQQIDTTYIKGLAVSGRTITYTKGDGSTGTITTQDTNTWTAFKGATSSANGTAGYVPAPTKGNQNKFFKADGTWATPTNTTYSNMTAATASTAGKAGLVPAPAAGKQTSFLRGDGTWVVPTNTTYASMSASEATTGTATAARTISAKVLHDKINSSLSAYSKVGHTHDDRYYTETEVNNLLKGKANTSHSHDSVRTSDNNHAILFDWSNKVPGYVGLTVDKTLMGGIVTTNNIRAHWYAAYPDGAEAHNAMWGGRDITAAFDAGTVSANIANGTFKDIFPGDYITKQVTIPRAFADDGVTVLFDGGTYTVNWVVADCDYWINKGSNDDPVITAHHVAIVPQVPIFNARMHSTNTTTDGGYAGSDMYRKIIPACARGIVHAFGSSHILTFGDGISNSADISHVSSGIPQYMGTPGWWGEWVSVYCNLMSEKMVYGAPICAAGAMDNSMATRQMSAFRLSEKLINYNHSTWWLRDVVSSSDFALIHGHSYVYINPSSSLGAVRPFALLK